MCSELIDRGKDALAAMRFAQGIAWSIVLLFSVPFVLIGGMALILTRSYKNALKRQNDSEHSSQS